MLTGVEGIHMTVEIPSLDEFKAQIETQFGQSLTKSASDAAEDFWGVKIYN